MDKIKEESKQKIFKQRLDFYGQSLAAYLVILVAFFLLYGSLDDGTFTLNVFSPLIIFMLIIVLTTVLLLFLASLKRKEIVILDDSIIFKNRLFEKKFKFDEIQRIRISKSPSKFVKNDASFVRIKIKGKKKFLLIRTASFNNDKELLYCLMDISKRILKSYSN